ncbi:MAG: crosslink repair DNA glycosylase YcaQ family protein, partial [Chloroflexota bacterium]|nr:crosslink repair DNA glycosylase YcaQ family protein [Chloroflexota bacterium]
GYLLVIHRQKFQKVYELAERAYPGLEELDAKLPSDGERLRFLVENALKAQGVATVRDIQGYYQALRRRKVEVQQALGSLEREGLALPITVEGWNDATYIHRDNFPRLEAILAGEGNSLGTVLLSPFDSLISERARTRRLFGFDYTLQAYTPAAKRSYGYYDLPILHEGALVGQLDAKAHRGAGVLEVRGLWLEPEFAPDDGLWEGLGRSLASLRAFLGLEGIEWADGLDPALGRALGRRDVRRQAEPCSEQ